jgi:hypothetical protein
MCVWTRGLHGPKFIELYPTRGQFGPCSKFIFKYVIRTQPKPIFLLFQLERSPIYLQSALTIVSTIQVYFNA